MDERSKEILKKIRAKTVKELRDDEIRFLKARISYLTLDDKDKFASVLKKETVKETVTKKD